MTIATRKHSAAKYRCRECNAPASAWEGKCSHCGGWGTLIETGDGAPARSQLRRPTTRATRAPEAEMVIELLAARLAEDRQKVAGAVDHALATVSPARLLELAEELLRRHEKQRKRNPLGYLVTLANQSATVKIVPPATVVQADSLEEKWRRYETTEIPVAMKPLAGLMDVVRDRLKKSKGRRKKEAPDPPECKFCGGAQWVVREPAAIGEDGYSPQVIVACPKCTGEKPEDRQARLLALSGLRGPMLDMTLATLDRLPGLEKAVAAMERFIRGEISQVVLLGPTGRGKSHLGAAVVRECIDRGAAAVYLNVARFLDEVRASYDSSSEETVKSVMLPALEWPVCILDDLGAERRTEWAREKLYEVIDARYTAGLRTLVCSNDDVELWDARVRSRLCDRQRGLVVVISGETPDYRTGKG